MGIRKQIPGGDLVTEYYNRITALTLASLLDYVPEDSNIPATCIETGRVYTYSNGTWWSGCHPIYPDYPTAKSKVFQVGDECLIPKLVGVGTIRLRYESTGRLAVDCGQCIASQNEPHSVVNATGTTLVEITWITIPAGMIGDGEQWGLNAPVDTGANTGSDLITVYLSNYMFCSVGVPANSMYPNIAHAARYASLLCKTFLMHSTTSDTAIVRTSIDLSLAQVLKLGIRPATANVGNSTYFRYTQFGRIS